MPRTPGSKNKATLREEARQKKLETSIQCQCCGKTKYQTEFFYSPGSRFWKITNGRSPLCKSCLREIFEDALNELGRDNAMMMICAAIDIPFYPVLYAGAKKNMENFTIGKYTRLLNVERWRNKTFIDSLIDEQLLRPVNEVEKAAEDKWKASDKRNKRSVLQKIGYDPFESLTVDDRLDAFNIASGYLDIEGVSDDIHKIQAVIQIVQYSIQNKHIHGMINDLLTSDRAEPSKLKDLEAASKSVADTITRIAKENNFSSKYDRKDRSNLSTKMKELAENNYQDVYVNMFDVKTSAAMKQIADLSHASIIGQLDDNDYAEIVQMQRDLIRKNEAKRLAIEEELRIAQNTITSLRRARKSSNNDKQDLIQRRVREASGATPERIEEIIKECDAILAGEFSTEQSEREMFEPERKTLEQQMWDVGDDEEDEAADNSTEIEVDGE